MKYKKKKKKKKDQLLSRLHPIQIPQVEAKNNALRSPQTSIPKLRETWIGHWTHRRIIAQRTIVCGVSGGIKNRRRNNPTILFHIQFSLIIIKCNKISL